MLSYCFYFTLAGFDRMKSSNFAHEELLQFISDFNQVIWHIGCRKSLLMGTITSCSDKLGIKLCKQKRPYKYSLYELDIKIYLQCSATINRRILILDFSFAFAKRFSSVDYTFDIITRIFAITTCCLFLC